MKHGAEPPGPGGTRRQKPPAVPPRRRVSFGKASNKTGHRGSEVKNHRGVNTAFSPCAASSSASSLCSSGSQVEEGPQGDGGGRGDDKERGSRVVSFDPNLTIHLTGRDGSPLKGNLKELSKKAIGRENSEPAPSGEEVAQSEPKKAEDNTDNLEAAAPTKPDEVNDCYLGELYAQLTSFVNAKPDHRPPRLIRQDEAEDPSAIPVIWISKWVDYSDRYGLGYHLCDDSIGVFFNDFTKLLLLPDGENIHYIERNGQEHYYRLTDYPQTLDKKMTLLRYFRHYMNEHLLKAAAAMSPREGDELARIPSLKTYFRTRSAIILHLTNGTLQINFFQDHTKLILCPLMGAVTYIDTQKNFRTYRLALLEEYGCKTELACRLRYAKNMIQKLLLSGKVPSSQAED